MVNLLISFPTKTVVFELKENFVTPNIIIANFIFNFNFAGILQLNQNLIFFQTLFAHIYAFRTIIFFSDTSITSQISIPVIFIFFANKLYHAAFKKFIVATIFSGSATFLFH